MDKTTHFTLKKKVQKLLIKSSNHQHGFVHGEQMTCHKTDISASNETLQGSKAFLITGRMLEAKDA